MTTKRKKKPEPVCTVMYREHGNELMWLELGPFLVSRQVHRELGGPLYSAEGTHWWVAMPPTSSEVVGFASARLASTAAWVDYTYVVPAWRGRGVHAALAAARDAFLAEQAPGLPWRVAVREDRWHHYLERGWEVSSERGSWVHGIRPAKSP